jgi:hypothetical protein
MSILSAPNDNVNDRRVCSNGGMTTDREEQKFSEEDVSQCQNTQGQNGEPQFRRRLRNAKRTALDFVQRHKLRTVITYILFHVQVLSLAHTS